MGGIYYIKNIINKKVYIGQTITNFKRRWDRHKSYLKNKTHHNIYLQNAFNKYGEQNFIYISILDCDNLKELDELEIYLIKWCNDICGCYNIDLGGSLNKKLSQETKNKISKKLKGKKYSIEHNKKISEKMKGNLNHFYQKTHTLENRKKISNTHKNKSKTLEHRKKLQKNKIKVSIEQLIEINNKFNNNYSKKDLANEYNLSIPTINSYIIKKDEYINILKHANYNPL